MASVYFLVLLEVLNSLVQERDHDLALAGLLVLLVVFNDRQEDHDPHVLLEDLLLVEDLDLFTRSEWNLLVQPPCDPGMQESSLGVVPFYLTNPAELTDHIDGQETHVRWIVPLLRLNSRHLLLQGLAVVVEDPSGNVEWMEANEHVVESDSCTVNVDFFAVGLRADLFGGHEQDGANFLLMCQLDSNSLLCAEAKVNDFKILVLLLALRSKLYILRLDIPMNIIHFVNVIQTIEEASHDLRSFFFSEKRLLQVFELILLEAELLLPELERVGLVLLNVVLEERKQRQSQMIMYQEERRRVTKSKIIQLKPNKTLFVVKFMDFCPLLVIDVNCRAW